MEKKTSKPDQIFAAAVFAVLSALFILILFGEGIYKISGTDPGKAGSVSDSVAINWADLYPFQTADDAASGTDDVISGEESLPQDTFLKIYHRYDKVMSTLGTIGEKFDRHMPKYSDIAKWGYILCACFSDPGTGGTYIRLNNGYWTTVSASEEEEASIDEKTDALEELARFAGTQDIPFLYVQAPDKNCQYDTELPAGTEDYSNENISRLLDALDNAGVDYIDMREALHEDFEDHDSLYYKTDHHWTVDAGFWACGVLEQEIEDRYGIRFNTACNDISMYSRTTYQNAMFGSAGHAVTHFVEKSEDFSILFPAFETSFRLVIPDKEIDAEGTFEDIFIDYDGLQEAVGSGGGYAYEKILYGNRPLVQITNHDNENGPRVLMIRDSFSIAVSLYMAVGCSELDLIDTRPSNGNFTGSVKTYMEQMQPDIVIVLVRELGTSYE
jgi:hypothetical protein